jgi:dTDP-4-amino-4,6-dideoxygalactose transaminase
MMNTENTFQKGSIYLSEFPFPDLKSSKIRPVVVLCEEAISLPLYPSMNKEDQNYVIQSFKEILN